MLPTSRSLFNVHTSSSDNYNKKVGRKSYEKIFRKLNPQCDRKKSTCRVRYDEQVFRILKPKQKHARSRTRQNWNISSDYMGRKSATVLPFERPFPVMTYVSQGISTQTLSISARNPVAITLSRLWQLGTSVQTISPKL